jgi:hypothetical protein
VFIDSQFAADTATQGAAIKAGLKARFGHPNMCSTALGTFLGRWKNFRVDGDAVRADLYLSNSAKETPHGDLYSYVLDLAADDPDMFGTSIVFTIGGYKLADGTPIDSEFDVPEGEKVFVELGALHACDAVDEPAANDGLFSRFSGETIAGQVTEFFDLNPQMVKALAENDAIVDAIVERGDMFREFLSKYNSRIDAGKTEGDAMSEAAPVVVPEQPDTEALEAVEVEAVEAVEEEAVEEVEAEVVEDEVEGEEAPEVEALTAEDPIAKFKALKDEFGAEIAADVFEAGGSREDALVLSVSKLKAENEALRLKAGAGSEVVPVAFASDDGKPKATVKGLLFGNK